MVSGRVSGQNCSSAPQKSHVACGIVSVFNEPVHDIKEPRCFEDTMYAINYWVLARRDHITDEKIKGLHERIEYVPQLWNWENHS